MSVGAGAESLVERQEEHLPAQIRPIGSELGRSLRDLLGSIPTLEEGEVSKPTALARRLGINRVIVSRLLSAIAREEPYEVLLQAPGPESLRTVTAAAAGLGAPKVHVEGANAAIERFSALIRDQFGTRGALNAAISPRSAALAQRFEHASRYQVYKGMRQILGVDAETWLTSMIFVPSPEDEDAIAVTTIHGALGMRRLRPDVNVYFTFGPPFASREETAGPMKCPVGLEAYCTHRPAELESHVAGGQLVHRLMHDRLGRRAAVDMLAVSHDPRGSRRYASPERPRGGVVVYTDIPAKMLVCDAILHDSVFPGATPELKVYKPGSRGPANPNDPNRDIDRLDFPERIESLGKEADRFVVAEVPRYDEMIARVCEQIGMSPSGFRVHRLRMAYPVSGFQFVMAFDAPARSA